MKMEIKRPINMLKPWHTPQGDQAAHETDQCKGRVLRSTTVLQSQQINLLSKRIGKEQQGSLRSYEIQNKQRRHRIKKQEACLPVCESPAFSQLKPTNGRQSINGCRSEVNKSTWVTYSSHKSPVEQKNPMPNS